MLYEHVMAFTDALTAAKAALTGADVIAHNIIAMDAQATKHGGNAVPPRPSIIVGMTTVQPSLAFNRNGPQKTQLAVNKTRIMVVVESKLQTVNEATVMQENGLIEHRKACRFIRNFMKINESVAVPVALQSLIGEQPLCLMFDEPFDGMPGADLDGYSHTFYVLIKDLETLWPLRSP